MSAEKTPGYSKASIVYPRRNLSVPSLACYIVPALSATLWLNVTSALSDNSLEVAVAAKNKTKNKTVRERIVRRELRRARKPFNGFCCALGT